MEFSKDLRDGEWLNTVGLHNDDGVGYQYLKWTGVFSWYHQLLHGAVWEAKIGAIFNSNRLEINQKLNHMTIKYFYLGIEWDSVHDLIRVAKMDREMTAEQEIWRMSHGEVLNKKHQELLDTIRDDWDTTPAFGAKDAFAQENAERRMQLFSRLDPAEWFDEINCELIDEATFDKTRDKTIIKSKDTLEERGFLKPEDLETETISYKDTYRLYRAPKDQFGSTSLQEDIFFIQCKDTSTDRVYYLYPDTNVDGAVLS